MSPAALPVLALPVCVVAPALEVKQPLNGGRFASYEADIHDPSPTFRLTDVSCGAACAGPPSDGERMFPPADWRMPMSLGVEPAHGDEQPPNGGRFFI